MIKITASYQNPFDGAAISAPQQEVYRSTKVYQHYYDGSKCKAK